MTRYTTVSALALVATTSAAAARRAGSCTAIARATPRHAADPIEYLDGLRRRFGRSRSDHVAPEP